MINRDIDLRKEFQDLSDKFSLTVLYQRGSKYIRCRCFNELHKTGIASCKICNGTGKAIAFEKHDAIAYNPNPGTVKKSLRQSEVGINYAPTREFFLKHNVNPKVKDLIYEVGWVNDKPITLHGVYEIIYIDPIRGDNGRIELYSVHANMRNDNKETVESSMREIAKYKNKLRRR